MGAACVSFWPEQKVFLGHREQEMRWERRASPGCRGGGGVYLEDVEKRSVATGGEESEGER